MKKLYIFILLISVVLISACSENSTSSDLDNSDNLADSQWSNRQWVSMETSTSVLFDNIWGISSSDVYATGRGDLLHYDGISWSNVDIDTSYYVNDIWGNRSDNIYAVGKNGLFLHYDGTTWSKIETHTNYSLSEIFGIDDSTIYIQQLFHGLLKYQNGTIIDNTFDLSFHSLGIWGIKSKLHSYTDKVTNNLIFLGNAGTIAISVDNIFEIFKVGVGYYNDIHGTSMDNVFLVGTFARAIYFDGFQGHTINLPQASAKEIYGVWTVGKKRAFFVGSNGNILFYSNGELIAQQSGSTSSLRDIWGAPDGTLFVVGAGGTILKSEK